MSASVFILLGPQPGAVHHAPQARGVSVVGAGAMADRRVGRQLWFDVTADVLGSAVTVAGDEQVWATLTGLLDLELTGFHKHMR
ncbi:hypothetical protein ABZ070_06640 [Streptomyces sp. NPDC006283]|uniref:hypothetical protein n=1 Tax=Streptomyces sp. NPDC006283 TaxID=3156741 RepID=UPI0033BF54AF